MGLGDPPGHTQRVGPHRPRGLILVGQCAIEVTENFEGGGWPATRNERCRKTDECARRGRKPGQPLIQGQHALMIDDARSTSRDWSAASS